MNATDYWRSIILYGRNVATYKIALGQVLLGAAARGKSTISFPELAADFFRAYRERLGNGRPPKQHLRAR
jgi:hypothetical protein